VLNSGNPSVFLRFLTIFLPVVVLLSVIATAAYRMESARRIEKLEASERSIVEVEFRTLANDFRMILSDLRLVSSLPHLKEFLDTGTRSSREFLAQDYLAFSAAKRIYDQVRFLDERGMEIVRVNFNNGNPILVPENRLQPKGRRYYFIDTFQLQSGEVYVSQFDLNVERGRVERPFKPMIRFGTPVFDSSGKKRGIVVLNYLGAGLIEHLRESAAASSDQIMLLNRDGFWLAGPRREDLWGFMFKTKHRRRFARDCPDAWQRISSADSGQFRDQKGLYTFATVYPSMSAPGSRDRGTGRAPATPRYWKIVYHVPEKDLTPMTRQFLIAHLALTGLLATLAATGALLLARAQHRRKTAEEARERMLDDLTVAQADLDYKATHDELSGLWNRRAILEKLEEELARATRENSSLAVIMADVDHFKGINDNHGHLAGDAVLREVARRIRSSLRAYDSMGRYGGEEFVIIVPGTDTEESREIAERVRSDLSDRPIQTPDNDFKVTVSLGVALADPTENIDLNSVLRSADEALYRAKKAGRNRVETSWPSSELTA